MGMKLFVSNLAYSVTSEELEGFFQRWNIDPLSVKVVLDRETQQSRGFAFVEVADRQAEEALALGGKMFGGRPLRVQQARDRVAK